MDIQVVLTQDDPKLGKRGNIVKVSSGYAQNFLYPHRKAMPATPANLKNFELEKQRKQKEEAETKARAANLAKTLEKASVTVEVLTGDGEKLYGAVTSHEIQSKLAEQGIVLEKKEIHLEEPLKKLGAYQIPVKLYGGVQATLKVWVVRKT